MTNLWLSAAAAAIIAGALAGCASPQYPISASQSPAPAAAPAPVVAPPPAEPPPMAAPVPKVESQSLPPPTAAPDSAAPASQAGAPTSASPSGTPPDPPAPTTSSSPGPSAPATPASPPAADPAAPAATAAPAVASPADEAMTPRTVSHDASALPAVVTSKPVVSMPGSSQGYAEAPPRRSSEGYAVAGRVVDADGDVFENYEVQRGDHIDALARSFNTTRSVLLETNHIRSPYVIHPGEIMKVPVAKAYVAERGDTLAAVARRFSVPEAELAELNHISERSSLREGQRLGLPSSMRDRGPEREYASTGGYAAPAPRLPVYGYVTPPAHPGLTPLYPSTQAAPDHVPASGYATPPPQPAAPVASAPASGLSDAEISAAAKGRFMWPVRGDILARFGPTGVGRRNDGVDIKAAQGVAVMAAAGGEVVYAGDQVPGFGNLVLIKHTDGWVTAYAHLDHLNVQMKDQVTQGQTIGAVGLSGGVTEPELHFEVRYAPTPADKARPVDPSLVLPQG